MDLTRYISTKVAFVNFTIIIIIIIMLNNNNNNNNSPGLVYIVYNDI